MITISQDQIYERWDLLPDDLRGVLVSEMTSDFIDKVCTAEHIPAEKVGIVSRIAGFVISGFIHPGDFPMELANALQVDPRIAGAIAVAIDQRIFLPIRTEIDNAYAPPGAAPVPIASIAGPKVIQEIRPFVPVAAARQPLTVPSAMNANGPKVPIPQPAAIPFSSAPRPPKIVPDLQKIDSGKIVSPLQTFAISSPRRPIAPSPSEPAPVIMREDAATKPLAKAPDFHMVSDDKIASVSKFNPATSSQARPAVLEFGGKIVPQPPRSLGTNAVPQPPMPQQGRTIMELTGANLPPKASIPPSAKPVAPMTPPPAPPISSQPPRP